MFSLMRTPRFCVFAELASMALPVVLARFRPRISTPVRSPLAVLAITVTASPVATMRGRVPAGTRVGKPDDRQPDAFTQQLLAVLQRDAAGRAASWR